MNYLIIPTTMERRSVTGENNKAILHSVRETCRKFEEAKELAESILPELSHIQTQVEKCAQGEITIEILIEDVQNFVQSSDERIAQLWILSGVKTPNPSDS